MPTSARSRARKTRRPRRLQHPEHYSYDFDVAQIAEVWRHGSVVRSWLLDLTARALAEDAGLAAFAGRVSDSGEGRWTVAAAVDEGVPAPVITAALYSRFESRGNADYGDRLLSAMRKQFGGHVEKKVRRVTCGPQEYSRTIATISRMKSPERTPPLPDTKRLAVPRPAILRRCAADDRHAAA